MSTNSLFQLRNAFCRLSPIILALAVLLSSCSDSGSPEEQIRDYIDRAETAIENKETGDIRGLIADDYSDTYKNNRQDVVRILAGYFLRRPNIHLLVNIDEIHVNTGKSSAKISVYAAVSRMAVDNDDLNLLEASFYHLKGTLSHDDDWLLKSAELQRVSADSFLNSRK